MSRAIRPAVLALGSAILLLLASAAAAQILTGRVVDDNYPGPSSPPVEPRPLPPPPPPPPEVRDRPIPIGRHVPEVARYLDRLRLGEPISYRNLTVFPLVFRDGGGELPGDWLTMDQALARGDLLITEKAGGSVPVIFMENRSRDRQVLVLAGELVAGGKQTRTIRQDVILAPGQRVDVSVFCVEQHRWEGQVEFRAGSSMAPAAIQQEMRKGGDQAKVWSEVRRNNQALAAENRTDSLDEALASGAVKDRLSAARRELSGRLTREAVGYIFVDRARGPVGAEFFGRSDLARAMFGRLLDAYTVDLVLKGRGGDPTAEDRSVRFPSPEGLASSFLARIRAASSEHMPTPGSGSGITVRGGGLVGSGASIAGDLVHLGVQIEEGIVVPLPEPRPMR